MDRTTTLAPEHYFGTALEVLDELGPEGLTIAELCTRLGITKGSFYHHFEGMPGFVDDLLAFWEDVHNERLIALSRQEVDQQRRVELLVEIALGLPHGAEAAFRAWGRSNVRVREVQARVDERREKTLVSAITALGVPKRTARLHAQAAVAMLVGVQQRQHPVDRRGLRALFTHLNALLPLPA